MHDYKNENFNYMKSIVVHRRFAMLIVAVWGAIFMQAQVYTGVNPYLTRNNVVVDTTRYTPPSRNLNSLNWSDMRYQMQDGSRVITWEEVRKQFTEEPKVNDDRQLVRLQRVVFYEIRQSDNVSFTSQSVMNEIAEFMMTCQDAHINVVGFADRGTGNEALNAMYSQRRAMQFKYDMVNRYGVNPNSITTDAKGDYVQPFPENDKNRCVIVDGYGYLPITPAQPVVVPEVKERIVHNTDTLYISRTDTLLIAAIDSLKPEQPFGLNKAHNGRNWFVSLEAGPSIFQGDHNIDAKWGDRIYPAITFKMGKWIVPAIGLQVGVDLDMIHNYYDANTPNDLADYYGKFVHGASPDEPYKESPWLYRMDYKAWNFHGDVLINFSSFMWKPYNRRFWNLIGYFGAGCIVTWDHGSPEWHNQDWFNSSVSWNLGILNSFRVAEHFDINIDLRVKKFDDDFNCFRQGRSMDGITNLTVGFTWYFTKRGF